MTTGQRAEPKTLGLIGIGLVTFVQNQLWQGVVQAAQEHGARVVFYSLGSALPFNRCAQVLFDFIDARSVDGVYFWYAGVAERVGAGLTEQIFDRFGNLPVVTLGGQLKNYPNLSIDNYQGVRAATEHLIQVHHRRHIAAIRGPLGHPEADERHRAYLETLQAHGLSAPPEHVAVASFARPMSGEDAEAAIDRWLQASPPEIDAIVAGSDIIALAAIQALQARGRRVPEDIAVVGFDDVADAYANFPSLTTVRQPFYELGQQGAKMLLALMDGQSLPPQSVAPAQLVVRESCGCIAKWLAPVDLRRPGRMELDLPARSKAGSDAADAPDTGLPAELTAVARELRLSPEQLANLAALLEHDLHSPPPHHFLTGLEQQLTATLASHFDPLAWQNLVTALRNQAVAASDGALGPPGEGLLNQARVLVAELSQRAHIQRWLTAQEQIEILRRTSEALIMSFGEPTLLETLPGQLAALGFPSFYLSLYTNPEQPAQEARLLLAYDQQRRRNLPPEGLCFPTGRLIPDALPLPRPAVPLVVEPLYFGDEQLGLLVLEASLTEGSLYESLRTQISSALQGSRLLRQVQQYATRLEQRVAERTRELTLTVKRLEVEVAERQRAEAALRLTSFAVEHAADAVYWLDAAARVVDVNEAACQMLGYRRQELVGRSLLEIDPAFQAGFWPDIWAAVKGGGLPPFESRHLTRTGRLVPVELTMNYIAFEGQEFNCAFVRDVSRRKEAERAIRQLNEELERRVKIRTQQFEAANRELEAFTFSVSHDLRAPLRAINGFSRSLVLDYEASLPEQARYYLSRMQANTQRMGYLIDGLLALSRIGRQSLHLATVEMDQLVQEVLSDLSADNELGRAEIVVEPLPPCEADRALLKQVWVNLISNAIKYSSRRPQPRIEIRRQERAGAPVYLVKDNGVGFDMQFAGKLFGVFQRLHHVDEYEGTGIGLATVRRIIERHGGQVWAEAEVDKGATFYFTLEKEKTE